MAESSFQYCIKLLHVPDPVKYLRFKLQNTMTAELEDFLWYIHTHSIYIWYMIFTHFLMGFQVYLMNV